jgi:hypothetical protein
MVARVSQSPVSPLFAIIKKVPNRWDDLITSCKCNVKWGKYQIVESDNIFLKLNATQPFPPEADCYFTPSFIGVEGFKLK